jgi:hypothetical protein
MQSLCLYAVPRKGAKMIFRNLPSPIKMSPLRATNAMSRDLMEEETDTLAAGTLAAIVAGVAHSDAEAGMLDVQARTGKDINFGDENEKRCPECKRFLDSGHYFHCNPC